MQKVHGSVIRKKRDEGVTGGNLVKKEVEFTNTLISRLKTRGREELRKIEKGFPGL